MKDLENLSSAYDFYKVYQPESWTAEVRRQSILYAGSKNYDQKTMNNLTFDNFRVFDAVLLHSGYNPRPQRHLLWEGKIDVRSDFVCKNISRGAFRDIMYSLHFTDNSTMPSDADRFYKVRPIFDNLNRCSKYFSASDSFSIDEGMISYYGRHGCKQYIQNKPIKFGFKVWTLATSDGAGVFFEPYCGKSTKIHDYGLGQGPNVVLDLVDKANLRPGSRLYFDNLFTSFPLLDELSKQGFGGTGTLRQNRLHQVPLKSKKEVMKKSTLRGSSEAVYFEDQVCCVWKDNKPVYAASNIHSASTGHHIATRYSREQHKDLEYPMPDLLNYYNKGMGGVDLLDGSIKLYYPAYRSKKWWFPIYTWSLAASAVNAWRLRMKVTGDKEPYLDFLRELVLEMIPTHGAVNIFFI